MLEEVYRKPFVKKNQEPHIGDVIILMSSLIRNEPEFSMKHLFSTHIL